MWVFLNLSLYSLSILKIFFQMKPLEQPATITCGNGSIAQATIHIKSPSWWWKSRMSNTQGKEKLRERSYKKQMASVTSEVGTTLGATELLKCTDKALVKLRGPTPADRRYILSESSISIIDCLLYQWQTFRMLGGAHLSRRNSTAGCSNFRKRT